jgi:[CysO sulfur-carrier protein]-S-L-cysteine hydrolase
MVRHATEVMPDEAVGLLGGTADGTVRRWVPLPNLLGSTRFLADPYRQFQALRSLAAEGLTPLAVYHSHPGGGVGLSADDRSFASRLPYLQLVIALGPHQPTVRIAAYAVSGTSVEQAVLEVVEG